MAGKKWIFLFVLLAIAPFFRGLALAEGKPAAPLETYALRLAPLEKKLGKTEGDWRAALARQPALAGVKEAGGVTLWHGAALKGYVALMGELPALSASSNIPDETGDTPLHYAAIVGQAQAAAWLLQNGATADVWNETGLNPLALAALAGSREVTTLLLDHGASLLDLLGVFSEFPNTPRYQAMRQAWLQAGQTHPDYMDWFMEEINRRQNTPPGVVEKAQEY